MSDRHSGSFELTRSFEFCIVLILFKRMHLVGSPILRCLVKHSLPAVLRLSDGADLCPIRPVTPKSDSSYFITSYVFLIKANETYLSPE